MVAPPFPNSAMLPLAPKFTIRNYQLPLAVDREVAAHLRQIEGITVAFLTPIERDFSYTESQLGGLEITLADRLTNRLLASGSIGIISGRSISKLILFK
jgi:hypothetical protein